MNERTVDPGHAAQLEMQALLDAAVDRQVSDVHLISGHPVTFRIHGRLEAIDGLPLAGDDVRRLIESILPEGTSARLEEGKKRLVRESLLAPNSAGILSRVFHPNPPHRIHERIPVVTRARRDSLTSHVSKGRSHSPPKGVGHKYGGWPRSFLDLGETMIHA